MDPSRLDSPNVPAAHDSALTAGRSWRAMAPTRAAPPARRRCTPPPAGLFHRANRPHARYPLLFEHGAVSESLVFHRSPRPRQPGSQPAHQPMACASKTPPTPNATPPRCVRRHRELSGPNQTLFDSCPRPNRLKIRACHQLCFLCARQSRQEIFAHKSKQRICAVATTDTTVLA